MRGLRLENVTVAGVSRSIDLDVAVGETGAIDVECSRVPAVADVLVGLKPPRTGSAMVDGRPPFGDRQAKRACPARLVPSDGGLLPNLTILRNILYTECVVLRRPSEHPEKEVRHATAVTFGLNDVLDRYPFEVTVGRRRMAALARALRGGPSVVVLEDAPDAPTWGALLGADQFRRDAEPELPMAESPVELLTGVAAVLVTCDPERAHGFGTPARLRDGVGAHD